MCSGNRKILCGGVSVTFVVVLILGILAKPTASGESKRCEENKRSETGEADKKPTAKKTFLATNGEKFPYENIRLPRDVLPLWYRIRIQTDMTSFKFTGEVEIILSCEKDTNRVILNTLGLEITSVGLYEEEEGKNLRKLSWKKLDNIKTLEYTEHEQLLIQSKEKLSQSKIYMIKIIYKAALNDNLDGFYKSSYKTKNGETRYLATTHFEPTTARRAFPCFDEPDMKANFTIIMVHDSKFKSLSNMPTEKITHLEGGLVEHRFAESVKMSTYLVAFVVCDFVYIQKITHNGIKIRVWAPSELIDQAHFALDAAIEILPFYEQFFGVPFPLPKQDLIAIPDFSAGAMENWGLITYRLTSILYDPKSSSSGNKQWIATVVAHELAHQWFGNLVTMKWWNDLWLNEGFASFVEYIGVDHFRSEWFMMDQFLVDDSQTALLLDQLGNSHPISIPVTDPNQINAIFDSISYDKGASIIRMLQNVLGKNAFKNGLRSYLKKHAFGNAATDDLWEELRQASEKEVGLKHAVDVKRVMDTWTLQMGFPVITLKRDPNRNIAVATQKHFLIDPSSKPDTESKFGYKWEIPLTYYTETSDPKKAILQWFGADKEKVIVQWPQDSGWIKLNVDQMGFYRVNYEEDNWKSLTQQLLRNHKVFSAADRAGLIDDAFNLARAGAVSYPTALGMTAYLPNEEKYIPWITFLGAIAYIGGQFIVRPNYGLYEKYMLQQLSPLVDQLGWEKDIEDHLQRYLRTAVLGSACRHGHLKALDGALKRFNDWMVNGKPVDVNLRSVVYASGIREGGIKEWEFVYDKYRKEQVPTEKKKLMYVLSESKQPWILSKLLNYSLDDTKIKTQDTVAMVISVAGNPVGRLMAWNFVRMNWKTFSARYKQESFEFSRLIKSLTSHFNTPFDLKQVEDFFNKQPDLGTGERAVRQAIESIKSNIQWLANHEAKTAEWLKNHINKKRSQKSKKSFYPKNINPAYEYDF